MNMMNESNIQAEIEKRFSYSNIGRALFENYKRTNGFAFDARLPSGKMGQFVGGKENKILLNEKLLPDLFFYTIAHETAHARQHQEMSFPFKGDPEAAYITSKMEPFYDLVIEADAIAKGFVAFVKSNPNDKELNAFRINKLHANLVAFWRKNTNSDEQTLLKEVFKMVFDCRSRNLPVKCLSKEDRNDIDCDLMMISFDYPLFMRHGIRKIGQSNRLILKTRIKKDFEKEKS